MIISEIRYNQIVEKLRFDAEFYKPEYLEAEEIVKKFPHTKPLGELTTSIINGVDIREFVPIGISYLRVGDMKEIFIDIDNSRKVRVTSNIKKEIKLKEGDLLFARKGTIGITCIVTDDLKDAVISTELIKVRLKEVNPYYVAVFFNSKYGRKQLLKISSGAVNPVITRDLFESVFVLIPPLSFQQKIELLVKEAYKNRKEADEKYKQAEFLLNKALGIEKLELKDEMTFETRFDEIESGQRFDADFYLPKYTEVLKVLKKSEFELKKLKEVCKETIRRINPIEKPSEKFTYIEIGDVDISTGEIEVKSILGYEAPPNARRFLKKGDLVISMVRPTRGAITIIPDELDNSLASTAFYILEIESP
ncbi:MAG TPA: restriction endonuclease subunit S, partial [Caldisericia bacterium]|nr:restriction endonuclease subunit S [Caldisericia bacterium]